MLKQFKLLLIIHLCLISVLLLGCENDQTISTSTVQFKQDYTSQELIDKIHNDIKFGMSKEELIQIEDKKPDADTTNSSDEEKGILYQIHVNDRNANLIYYINNNDNLYMITLAFINKEKIYDAYVDNYKSIYDSLIKIYGEPTENNDKILNPDDKNYGYELWVGNSKYSSNWDLNDIIIDSFMWKIEDNESVVTQVNFKSKEYVE